MSKFDLRRLARAVQATILPKIVSIYLKFHDSNFQSLSATYNFLSLQS